MTAITTLPIELRLRIYELTLATSHIQSFRPQRKIGWNRPHADLSNPIVLFESECHPVLKQLFHNKLTKGDAAVALIALLHHAKVLCLNFNDFAAVQRLVSVNNSLSSQARRFALIVREQLRTIDFSDKLDEIICQPTDLIKFLVSLPGLKSICLTSKHFHRYSGSIEDHIDFAKSRANKELLGANAVQKAADNAVHTSDELRRLSLRSPMTDGTRMLISPVPWAQSRSPGNAWVVVDLSLLVWQHFLYSGAPYRDHWRCAKMQTLFETAANKGISVVLNFRTVEFDPVLMTNRNARHLRQELRHSKDWQHSGTFRGEMSTKDWILRLRHRSHGTEYCIKQRIQHDVVVNQESSGVTRCRHRGAEGGVCADCMMKSRN